MVMADKIECNVVVFRELESVVVYDSKKGWAMQHVVTDREQVDRRRTIDFMLAALVRGRREATGENLVLT